MDEDERERLRKLGLLKPMGWCCCIENNKGDGRTLIARSDKGDCPSCRPECPKK